MKSSTRRKSEKSNIPYLIFYSFLFLATVWVGSQIGEGFFTITNKSFAPSSEKSPEIKKMLASHALKEQEYWYIKHIEKVGPVQAQDDFQHSGVPYNGQMHLLNHTVGDYIYKKFGPRGITMCKDYFSSSCFHGFIIRGIGNGNLDNVDTMMNECRKYGVATYAQCSHALGHGLLAWTGYENLLKALSICDEMEERAEGFVPNYCHNGVFMENIWGLHEGKPSPDRWVKASDIHYPCSDPRIAEKYLPECWYNQAIYMYSHLKNDMQQVSKECQKVTGQKSQEMCFDAIFRNINTTTLDDIPLKFEKCESMPVNWRSKCIEIVASASYQQGDMSLPLKICSYSMDENIQKQCYKRLYTMVNQYTGREGRYEFCMKIPSGYRDSCPGKTE
jgi:hypothetical protein